MDIDCAIRKDKPDPIIETSTAEAVCLYDKWERSNRLSVMFIKTKISAGICGSIEQIDKVKPLLKAIDEQFVIFDKDLASILIMQFSSTKLIWIRGVRDHIMRIRDIEAQLKSLEVTMSDTFLVHYLLKTLPQQYSPFKISYNTHKDKWSINELLTMCVQEEGRLMMEEGEKVNLTTFGKKRKDRAKIKGKILVQLGIKKESKCFFGKKKGHMKKDCSKFKIWLDKKGTQFSFVCYESNMVNVNHSTWWIDSGSTIHVSNTLQGMPNLRKTMESEQCIYSGSKMSSRVEAIGTCILVLSCGFILELEKTFYVPSFSRNLISISRLLPLGFSFNFTDSGFSLSNKSKVIGYGALFDGLFHIQLHNDVTYNSMHVTAGLKRCVMNDESSMLWHRRLGHISIQRMKKLVNDGVLSTLDFSDFVTCVNCIKGKQTNKSKRGAKRSTNLLEIIHTDICCPDMDANGPEYFITFIDDYLRCMYLYLLRSKDEALGAFKVFKDEVENQCGKHIKIVRSNRGGEYYGKYTENG